MGVAPIPHIKQVRPIARARAALGAVFGTICRRHAAISGSEFTTRGLRSPVAQTEKSPSLPTLAQQVPQFWNRLRTGWRGHCAISVHRNSSWGQIKNGGSATRKTSRRADPAPNPHPVDCATANPCSTHRIIGCVSDSEHLMGSPQQNSGLTPEHPS